MKKNTVHCLLIGGVLSFATIVSAADGRLDLRLKQAPVGYRMSAPRLALGTLKEKTKDEELHVKQKRKVSKRKPISRVAKADRQRKRKTKRVVASQ